MKADKFPGLHIIAVKNLRYQRFKTAALFLLIFLMTVFLFASKILVASMEKGIEKTSERIGADLIAVPANYVETVQNSLFSGKLHALRFAALSKSVVRSGLTPPGKACWRKASSYST